MSVDQVHNDMIQDSLMGILEAHLSEENLKQLFITMSDLSFLRIQQALTCLFQNTDHGTGHVMARMSCSLCELSHHFSTRSSVAKCGVA